MIEIADQTVDVPEMPCPTCQAAGRVECRWRVFVDADAVGAEVVVTPRRIECVVCEEGVDLYGREFTLGGPVGLAR